MTGTGRPLTFVFCLLHAGFLRHFGPVVELLAARGHRVHLAFTALEKDAGDARLAEELAGRHEGITFGLAPQRRRRDPWRVVAGLARSFADLARYSDPRFANAPKLRARVADEVAQRLRGGPVARRLVALVAAQRPAVARRLIRALAVVERLVPPSRRINAWLRSLAPDAVLVSPLIDFGSTQVDYLKSAARIGVPSGVCVASWDNLTGKGLIRVVPDRVFVWNEAQRREAAELHGVPAGRVVATGAPKFDEWFERRPVTSAAAFRAKVGLPDRPYVLYLCSSPFIAPDEVGFVRDWVAALRRTPDALVRDLGALVRPHPQNAAQWVDADLGSRDGVVVWPRAGAQPDAGEARADFFDSMAHSAAVVGVNTSALIESAILGKGVFTILDPRFAETQGGTLHFEYLRRERRGFLREARTLAEHVAQLAEALAGPAEDEQTRRFVEAFVRPHGLRRAAAPILADAIEELARGR
jgi:hypothetical protein